MSRGAVAARAATRRLEREAAKLDEWYRRAVADEALDAVLAACDGCGLVQVAPGPPCVVCGSETGTFVGYPSTLDPGTLAAAG